MKKFTTPNRIKTVCAFILLACIILPFSSCTTHLDEDGKAAYISKKPVVKSVTEYSYPWKEFIPNDFSSWLFIYSFLWPIPILIHRYRSSRKRLKQVFWGSEVLFIAGASYVFYMKSHILQSPAFGAYLALSANALYGVTWLSEIVLKFKKRPTSHST